MKIGFALCGSLCSFEKVFPIMEKLAQHHDLTPIFTPAALQDSRFGKEADHLARAEAICGKEAITTLAGAEPIGPKGLFDVLVIAPCTGNTLSRLAHGIADSPVTMGAKSHLRNGRPVVVAFSTNDGLGAAGENIGRLLVRRDLYFVPFGQDDPVGKPRSLAADFGLLPETVALAAQGRQLQPMVLGAGR